MLGEHVRVPREIDVVRWHEEVFVVAVSLHEGEKSQVPSTGGVDVAASRARDLPEEGALACRACLHVVVKAQVGTYRGTLVFHLSAERRLIR